MKSPTLLETLTTFIILLSILTPVLSVTPHAIPRSGTQAPTATRIVISMTIVPVHPQVNETIDFQAQASGGSPPYNFSWTFGDGTPSATGQSTSHIYLTAGTYYAQLDVSDSNSSTASRQQAIIISAPPPPPVGLKGDFTFQPASPIVGTPITFMAAVDGGNAPYLLVWSFGDGSTTLAASSSPSKVTSFTYTTSHSYAAAGSYTVSLTVSDSSRTTVQAYHPLTVMPAAPIVKPLTADFNPVPQSTTIGRRITFSAQATGGTSPYTYTWNLGDGTMIPSSARQTITHLYTMPGNYTVTLTVLDSRGLQTTVSHEVQVTQLAIPLTVSVSTNPNVGEAGHNMIIRAIINGGLSPYTVHWDFGDGQVGNGTIPIILHEYASAGMYNLTVNITDSKGVAATGSKQVRVTVASPTSQPSQSNGSGQPQSSPGDILTNTNAVIVLIVLASIGAAVLIFMKTGVLGRSRILKIMRC